MIKHAQEEYPLECCGILAGRGNKIVQIFPGRNMEKSQYSFLLDPEEQFRTFQKIEKEGLELLAIYHSHPHSSAYPSPRDIELAFYPDAFMIIISLFDKENPGIAAYQVKEGKVTEVELRILLL